MDNSISATTKVEVLSVDELFSSKIGKRLRVPAYQRKYAWTSEQVIALCKDILAADAQKRREYHIGTLILHENDECMDIVDGQQRLTSICILINDSAVFQLEVESGNEFSPFGKISAKDADILREDIRTKGVDLVTVQTFLRNCTFVVITVKDVAEAFQLFDTQNGRGKPLTPDNLLKAYHFHEMTHGIGTDIDKARQYELEEAWEGINKGGEVNGSREQRLRCLDGPLLPHLIREHLFRLRRWSRGDDALRTLFETKYLGEFKGVTLGEEHRVPPCHATAFLRHFFRRNYGRAGLCLESLPSRMGAEERDPHSLDPFQSIPQQIVNGEDFFLYIQNCATAYRLLFGNTETVSLATFRKFHLEYCLEDPYFWHLGNCYSRHIFESLCLLLFDRFGREGLMAHYLLLYRFAYWERSRNARLWYQSAGETFAPYAIRAMMASETFTELDDALSQLKAELDQKCKADPRPDKQTRYLFEKGWLLVNGEYESLKEKKAL
jgi:hypothetical protein